MKPLIVLVVLAALGIAHETFGAPSRITAAEAAATAQERFIGEVIDVALDDAEDDEPGDKIYEVKLLTPSGDVLSVRVSAADGRYLGAEGPDLARAQRPVPVRKPSP